MKTLLARTAGFCRGVRRAVDMALREAARRPGGLATRGPLIHNPPTVKLLAARGVRPLAEGETPPPGVPVMLRAHGASPEERERWREGGRELLDATCPTVRRSQAWLRQNARGERRFVLLAGDPGHAEMKALAGVAGPDHAVLAAPADADRVEVPGPALLLAQTTFGRADYDDIAGRLAARGLDVVARDSICDATDARQAEARGLAARADALVVVGGRDSANTRRLADAGRALGKPTFHVETEAELRPEDFAAFGTVAVTAGASTPGWMTQAVLERLEKFGRRRLGERLWRGVRSLARARILSALGAAGLGWLVFRLVGAEAHRLDLLATLALYFFFAYTLNRRVPPARETRELVRYDPFFDRHRRGLLFGGALAGLGALAFALHAAGPGHPLVWGVAAAEALALWYASPVLRGRSGRHGRTLPASKDVAVAAAWTSLLALAAWTALPPGRPFPTLAFGFACGLVFLLVLEKTAVLDLRDRESDALVGLETLPGLIGGPWTARLLYAGYAGLFALILAMAGLGLGPGWLGRLLALPAYGCAALALLNRGWFRREADMRIAADAQLILAGLLAL